MARKQDTRTLKAPAPKKASKKADAAPLEAAKDAKSKSKKSGKTKKAAKSVLPDVRKQASAAVRMPVSATTKAVKDGKKVVASARAQAKELLGKATPGDADTPVSETVRTIGNQITGWLTSDVGRVLVAELLVYIARQLTAKGEAAGPAKGITDAIVSAGAKIGAATADAGAQMLSAGRHAADEVAEAAKSDAGSIVQNVAKAAVGAVGEVVAEVAEKAIRRKGGPRPTKEPDLWERGPDDKKA